MFTVLFTNLWYMAIFTAAQSCSTTREYERVYVISIAPLVPWLAAAARVALGARCLVVVQGKDVEGHLRASAVGMLRSGCCTMFGKEQESLKTWMCCDS